ncbi:MAG: V-type ATP synthase subunit F [Oscillospiraceae bacterium]|nr:V-type ATP synthase subunit F [Oscillospiraceae bacterium]MBQ7143771.1 V-type ATP synthase subunit F [Oscillospiraceae bacterium]
MYKIAVIGGPDSVIGFRALGLDAYPVSSSHEAKQTLREITKPSNDPYVIIYLEETLAEPILDDIKKYNELPTPAIILIPGRDGPIGIGQNALQQAVEKAVGTNIL